MEVISAFSEDDEREGKVQTHVSEPEDKKSYFDCMHTASYGECVEI